MRVHARAAQYLVASAILTISMGSGCGGSGTSADPVTPAAISVTVSTTAASVQVGATQVFTATVANDGAGRGVTWALSGAGCSAAACGTLSAASSGSGAAVTYTAPASVPSPATVTLTATAVADGTKSAAATITVTAPSAAASVTITPARGGLTLGQTMNFTAATTPAGGTVTWTASVGTITPTAGTNSATYVAPASPGVVTITATSGLQAATATIGVTDLAGVTTYHNDLSRDGANIQEYALTTANVAPATFGKLFSCPVDGAVYAQPLWVPSASIGGGTHNVVVVATMRDSVYVFDADASPCVKYWSSQLVPPGETYGNSADVGSSDIYPDIGITGTPVIDPSSNTIYAVSKTKTSGGTYNQRLHALNLATGAEATNSPVPISASVTGNCEGGTAISFNALTENQRSGLALVNGVVYVSWASHGDIDPYHGWVLGYQTANLTAAPSVLNTSPQSTGLGYCRGGIWMSGGAPAADASNNLFLATGNGAWDGTKDFGDSFLKLGTPALAVLDYFTPHDQSALDSADNDLGAGGTALLVDQAVGPAHLLVAASKAGEFYVINRDNLGHFNASSDPVVQEFALSGPCYSTPGFWNNNLYYFGVSYGSTLAGESHTFNPTTGLFGATPAHTTPSTFGFAGATPSISASSATTNGIVWAIDTGAYGTRGGSSLAAGPAILHAFDANDVSTELWNSSQAAEARDAAGYAVKFTVPTVANGKVYVGTRGNDDTQGHGTVFGEIDVYGLLPN